LQARTGFLTYGLGQITAIISARRQVHLPISPAGDLAQVISVEIFDDHSAGSAFNNMGLALESAENFDEARQAYLRALKIFKRIDDQTGVSTCYNNLGSACYACGDFDQSLKWYELDLVLSESRGNWTDMAATLHNLGHVALEQKAYEQAQAYFERSRDLYAAFELTDYVAEEEEMIEYIQTLN
jgi:tetratricopeptide (TPR) repeat protein